VKSEMTPVYWDTLQHHTWTFHLAATAAGVCCITLPNETFSTLEQWVAKHVPGATLVHDEQKLNPFMEQLQAYLNGQRKVFTLPLDFKGTPFQVRVWRTLLEIPFGETGSYSQIAAGIGHPTAVRAVGSANGANPIPIVVPCHRIIGKNGTLTGYRGGVAMKAELLRLEGLKPNA